MRPRVLLADAFDAASEARLAARADIVRAPSPDPVALARLLPGCVALLVRTHNRVPREVLAAGTGLRVVGVAGVGTENVDVAAAQELGIAVLNTPAAASDAVAEFTLALLLQLLRPIPKLSARYASGHFRDVRSRPHGRELRELTVGILGMGRIGSRFARMCAAGCGARVQYNDIVDIAPPGFAARPVGKEELWATSDVVSLHVPLTPQTRGLIDGAVLKEFRPGALLINTARGAVIHTPALVEALAGGRLGGAALDVTDPEPLPAGHPLFSDPRCILTPHVAARTDRGLANMLAIVDDVLDWLARS